MSTNSLKAQNGEMADVALSKTEQFIAKNGKQILFSLLALALVVGGYFSVRAFIVEPRQTAALDMMFMAQERFGHDEPNYTLVLEGDSKGAGMLEVIENYGATPAGNLATHYAGISYLKLGELEKAAIYLSKFKPVKGIAGAIISGQNLALQGDIATELGDYTKAVKLYKKAIKLSNKSMMTPKYLIKAALAANANGDTNTAVELLYTVKKEYPNTNESEAADRIRGTIQ